MSSKHYSKTIIFHPLQQLATKSAIFTLVASLMGCAAQPNQPLRGGESSPPAERPRVSAGGAETPPVARPSQQTQTGSATYIGAEFEGKKTASGEIYERSKLVAAHPTYALGTVVRVTNLGNGRVVEVRVIDRLAAARGAAEAVIDLSGEAAEQLGFTQEGKAQVRTEVMSWGGERGEQ